MLLGTAFDYLFRFELKRRWPHACERKWVAENAIDTVIPRLSHADPGLLEYLKRQPGFQNSHESVYDSLHFSLTTDTWDKESSTPIPNTMVLREILERFVSQAKQSIESYRALTNVGRCDIQQVAERAIQLAKIDSILRAGLFDNTFEIAEPALVSELMDLFHAVAWDNFAIVQEGWLNPVLGSARIGLSADADLLIDGRMIDIKVTSSKSIEVSWLDQLLIYFLLFRNWRQYDQRYPEVKTMGIYLARHGLVQEWPCELWTNHPGFSGLENWFTDLLNDLATR
jgi:hypothetical protein